MERGTPVIRKTDLNKNIPIFGVIEGITRDGKAVVGWQNTSSPLVLSHGNSVGDPKHHSTLSLKSLVEATPEIQRRVWEVARARRAQRRREMMAERIYVCMNVNPLARVSNDGHPKPLELAPGQVKDGKCWYCKAPVFKRCSEYDCCTPVVEGSAYCEEHQP